MKQYLVLGLTALVLFSVSAALSVWLNQSHTPTEEKSTAEGATARIPRSKRTRTKRVKRPEKGHAQHPQPKSEGAGGHESSSAADIVALRGREERLARRQAQTDMILRDLQAEREAVNALMRQVTAEAKEAAARPPEPEPKVIPKKEIEAEAAAERKNIEQLAGVYGAMAPESAAPILKQMADSGRLDTAVRIIATMKDRQAAQVLAAMSDPALAAQITDKVRVLRRLAPAPIAPLPAPARGGP